MNGDITHAEFYGYVANESGIGEFPEAFLSRVRIALKSGDDHLNTIKLGEWDTLADRAKFRITHVLKSCGDFYSMAGGVCVMKQAAKIQAKI